MNEDNDVINDELFQAYAQRMQKQTEQSSSGGGNFTPREYDKLMWSGLERGFWKVYRLLGAPPGSEAKGYKRKPHDALELIYTEVKDDNGKRMQLKLPTHGDVPAKDHIIHRLTAKVREVEWIKSGGKSTKVFKNKDKAPKLFEYVDKAGWEQGDGFVYTITKGLVGQTVVVFNVIDRQDTWCRDNKHTKLLSKKVSIGDNGEIMFPFTGIPSWGFNQELGKLVQNAKIGGNYENYDVAIMATGEKQSAYKIANASYKKDKDTLEELENTDGTTLDPKIIVCGPLTKEERGYERYDLDKFFAPTTYQKILKRMASVFKECDAALGTKFYDELLGLVETEKKLFEELYGKEKSEDGAEGEQVKKEAKAVKESLADEPIEQDEVEAKPTRRAAKPAVNISADKIAMLRGWDLLTDREKAQVKEVAVAGGKVKAISYTDDAKAVLACDNVVDGAQCGVEVPSDFGHCPVCACQYEILPTS